MIHHNQSCCLEGFALSQHHTSDPVITFALMSYTRTVDRSGWLSKERIAMNNFTCEKRYDPEFASKS